MGGSYAELTVWAWTVEREHKLPLGMRGYTYIGFLNAGRILSYDTEEEINFGWWCNPKGKSGYADTAEIGLKQMLKEQGITNYKVEWK